MLPPSAVLEWGSGGLTISRSVVIARRREMSRRGAMDAYVDLFRAAIARRGAPARALIVPLSGGHDSRHIVLELCRQGIQPDECVTAQYPPAEKYKTDVEVAAQLCAALGIPHHVPRVSTSIKSVEQEKNQRTSYTTTEHAWFMPVGDRLCSNAAVSYDGMAGDVLSAGHFLTQERHDWFERRQFREFFLDMQWALTERTMQQLLPVETRRRFNLDLALERFEVECLPHLDAPNPVGSFSIFNRTRRVACLSAYALQPSVPYVFSPFLDNDLFDFLSSLPAEFLVDHNFHHGDDPVHISRIRASPLCRNAARTELCRNLSALRPGSGCRVAGQQGFRAPPQGVRAARLARCLVDSSYSPSAKWLGTS